MTSKEMLIGYLIKNGNNRPWSEIGAEFNMTGEAARAHWKKYRKKYIGQMDLSNICEGMTPCITNLKDNQDITTYVVQLEETVAKLALEANTPASRLVRSFNPGPNPLDYSLEMQKDYIMSEMKKASPKSKIPRDESDITRNTLLELAIFDLHIGKLAWAPETGEDYDFTIAVQRYKDAVESLVHRVDMDSVERIVLPIGNDMMNVDSKMNMTTAGTPQSCDSRFGKMFRLAKDLLIETINKLTQYCPVDVVVIPGNHDESTMFTLGEVLDAWFHNDDDVKIYNEPKLRKYYQYGQVMLMYTHGDKEKHSDLGMIAASEEPMMWGTSHYREVHLGHLHKSKAIAYLSVDEYQGFKIRILPSLSSTDAWHASKGYGSLKSAEAYVWHKDKGLISNHFYNL